MNDGGPAFPNIHTDVFDDDGHDLPNPRVHTTQRGLSVRDYFAGQVLANLAGEISDARVADVCYQIADAMLKAREGK